MKIYPKPVLLCLMFIVYLGINLVAIATSDEYSPVLTYEDALPRFQYDSATVPFSIKVISEKKQEGVIVQSITYAAYDAQFSALNTGRNIAYLIKPNGKGPFAAVLFMHEVGNSAGTRDEFYDDAVVLAKHGAVCLLPQGITPWRIGFTGDGATDQKHIIKQVIELRRGIDLLTIQPGVDPERIAYVGHDFSALHGCLLAGVDRRVKAYIIMAGITSYSDWSLIYPGIHPSDEKQYRRILAGTDPINYISHAAPSALLFQFGNNDKFVSRTIADQLYKEASQPKNLIRYEGVDHELELNDQTAQDRKNWLLNELCLVPSK